MNFGSGPNNYRTDPDPEHWFHVSKCCVSNAKRRLQPTAVLEKRHAVPFRPPGFLVRPPLPPPSWGPPFLRPGAGCPAPPPPPPSWGPSYRSGAGCPAPPTLPPSWAPSFRAEAGCPAPPTPPPTWTYLLPAPPLQAYWDFFIFDSLRSFRYCTLLIG